MHDGILSMALSIGTPYNLYENEVENHMQTNDVKLNVILKVGYQYSSARVGGH